MSRLKRVGIYARPDRLEALEAAKEVFSRLKSLGVEVYVDSSLRGRLRGVKELAFFDLRLEVPEALVIIGGDGTLLRALTLIGERASPLLHLIKVGRRAFYFELGVSEGIKRLEDFVEGRYQVEPLMRLKVELNCIPVGVVLNDAVVVSTGSKTIDLRVEIDEDAVVDLEGDGLVISTPAGSTAYTYSAGGPLVDKLLEAMILTPLNPLVCVKPIVVHASSVVRVEVKRVQRPPLLILDGQRTVKLKRGDVVRVTKSEAYARIARYGGLRRLSIPRLPLPGSEG